MPAIHYDVKCYTPGCESTASHKIASRWSDGQTEELKTYGLSCESHLQEWLKRAQERQATCRLAPGEILDPPVVYERIVIDGKPQLKRV